MYVLTFGKNSFVNLPVFNLQHDKIYILQAFLLLMFIVFVYFNSIIERLRIVKCTKFFSPNSRNISQRLPILLLFNFSRRPRRTYMIIFLNLSISLIFDFKIERYPSFVSLSNHVLVDNSLISFIYTFDSLFDRSVESLLCD